MDEIYYIIENGKQKGPFSKQQLKTQNITQDTYVWRAGMTDWQRASALEEIADIFAANQQNSPFGAAPQQESYYAMKNGMRVGPLTIDQLIMQGITPDTPVWRTGMADWTTAEQMPELRDRISFGPQAFGVPPTTPPGFNPGPQYAPGSQMPQPNFQKKSQWMTWSIVATIAGFLCGGCIAGIFGIIGINKAQKANALYAAGDEYGGSAEDNSAKTWTIISLVITAWGIISSFIIVLTEPNFFQEIYGF